MENKGMMHAKFALAKCVTDQMKQVNKSIMLIFI